MANFPVDLNQVYFTRSIVISNPNFIPDGNPKTTITPNNSINVQKVENSDSEYVVTMRMIFNPDNDPASGYSIDMECVGLFSVTGLPDEEALRAVTIVGHSVVYGAIREAVLWITGRHPFGPLSLGVSVLEPRKKTENKSD